jgi:hypothetical protein
MTLRIRFRITERADLLFSPAAKRLTFAAAMDDEIPEADRLALGTPSISFTAICDNPAALDLLDLGADLYFDVKPVPE